MPWFSMDLKARELSLLRLLGQRHSFVRIPRRGNLHVDSAVPAAGLTKAHTLTLCY